MSTGLRAAPAQKKVPSRSTYAVLISLTVTTGVIDAASYIGLGHVFTANMTGNIVLLGFGLAGAGHLPVLAPLVSLASFLVGSRIGGVLAARALASGRSRLSPALLCEGTLTGRATARLAPRARAASIARSTAAFCPAMTTWPGELKFAASTTAPCAASRQAASTASSSRPRMAAMAPVPAGTAACIT